MNSEAAKRVHRSFWLIGAFGLVFNLMGCMNFIAQMNADMVAKMPDVYRAMVDSRPAWGTGAFAMAVFGGAAGCLLLLMRKPAAVYVLIVSLLGAVVAQIPFFGMESLPLEAWIGWLSQLLAGAFLVWYSTRAKETGLLR